MGMDGVMEHPGVDATPGEPNAAGCRYRTAQPAPTQWVAIGVARLLGDDGVPRPRLLVEVGRSEEEAVAALRCRCG